jgi:hypothetical protein
MRPCHKYVEFDAATFTRDGDQFVQQWRFMVTSNGNNGPQPTLTAWTHPQSSGCRFNLRNTYPKLTPRAMIRSKYPDLMAYDLAQMTANMTAFKRELLEVVMHPRHVHRLLHLGLV